MKTILFQGDSVTDGGRLRQDPYNLGAGYPAFVAARLGLNFPEKYEFYNRGVAGNSVVDVYARIKKDIINIKPDYMSLLVGVNDVWHELDFEAGVNAKKYRKIYSMMLEEILDELPNVKILLIEPFVLKGIATDKYYDELRRGVEVRAGIVRDLAQKYQLPCLPLQEDLDTMQEDVAPGYWLHDGAHPTLYFHQYIANKWLEWFRKVNQES